MMLGLLFWLVAGHFICDYVFQNETIARNKRRVLANRDLQPGFVRAVPWYWWMIAHAFTHGVWVAAVTSSALLGIFETVLHFAIDCGKCEGWYGLKTDQGLHLACKLGWAALIFKGA